MLNSLIAGKLESISKISKPIDFGSGPRTVLASRNEMSVQVSQFPDVLERVGQSRLPRNLQRDLHTRRGTLDARPSYVAEQEVDGYATAKQTSLWAQNKRR